MADRTEAEWRALSERLGEEVMGWHREPPLVWWLDENGNWVHIKGIQMAWREPMQPFPWPPFVMCDWTLWQPHKDREQAMDCLEKFAIERDWAYLYRRPLPICPDQRVACNLWNHGYDVAAKAEALPRAICLAIEKALDAQKGE